MMTDYNDGKWHGWNGGECPVHHDTLVEVVYVYDSAAMDKGSAGYYCWETGRGLPIVAFRVVKEHKEPREFWLEVDQWKNIMYLHEKKPHEVSSWHSLVHVREVLDEDEEG